MKILHTRNILAQIDKEIEEIEFTSDNRKEVSLSLLDLSFDHAKSIVGALPLLH